jgi:hypothetical protein
MKLDFVARELTGYHFALAIGSLTRGLGRQICAEVPRHIPNASTRNATGSDNLSQ